MIKICRTILILILLLFGFLLGNVPANSEPTGIHKAALDGDLAKVKSLLKKDPKLLETISEEGEKPLQLAATGGHLKVVEFLLQQGVNINSRDSDNNAALHYASGWGHFELVKYLVSKGADINIKSKYGTPAYIAAQYGKFEILEYYIQKGADLSYREENGFGILHHCGIGASKEIVEKILEAGNPVNIKTTWGQTPLQGAVDQGKIEIVKLFIDKGADVNAICRGNLHPLYTAALKGHKEIVALLLQKGSSVQFKQKKTGQTPLHAAALRGFGEIINMLIQKGADPNAKDKQGNTPLYYACRYNHKMAAKALISKGAEWTVDAKKENEMNNSLLNKKFKPGSALVWYLFQSGFAIKTTNHLMIFDYFIQKPFPDTPLLGNGNIDPEELKDLNVTVFSSHSHGDHYSSDIFEWKDKIKKITYIMGFEPEGQSGYTYIAPRETKKINGLEITTIESNDSGVGFFVRVDGVSIFHSGDHANRHQDFSGPFKKEIDFLAEKNLKPDIFFAPVRGCGFGDQEAVKKGVFYSIKALSPKIMVPMHSGGFEDLLVTFAEKAQEAGFKTPMYCAVNKGDWFFVNQGHVKKSRLKTFENECKLSKNVKNKEETCNKKMSKSNCKKK